MYAGEKILIKITFSLKSACLTALQGPISSHFFYTPLVSAVNCITSLGLLLVKSDGIQKKHGTEYLTSLRNNEQVYTHSPPTREAHLTNGDKQED